MALSKLLNNIDNLPISAKGVLQDTLLLIFFVLAIPHCQARHRDTLGVGSSAFFVQNLGQWKGPILYKSNLRNAILYAETNRFTFILHASDPDKEEHTTHPHLPTKSHIYRVAFVDANADVDIQHQDIDPNTGYDNYYYGKDPSRWVTHLPHYTTLLYRNLYPGIDMDVHTATSALKTNFYISPGAHPSTIVMNYDGVEKLYLSGTNLIVRTSVGEVVEMSPYAYQETDTGRTEVAARYQIRGTEVRFVIPNYDTTLPLTIDPILHFSTYTGSTADNWGTTATYDSHKNTYTAGLVWNNPGTYPISTGAYDNTYNGNADIGIFKIDTSGTQRIFATYLGGSLADMPHSMYVNTFDELVIFGTTGSDDFPVTPNAYDTSFNGGRTLYYEGSDLISFENGSDIFVSRLSADGTQLQASTYIGGSDNDGLNYRNSFTYREIMCGNDSLHYNYGDGARGELITDDMNNVYIGSTTFSENFPTTSGSIQPMPMMKQNGVVFKLDYRFQNLIWSTYLGGSDNDAVYSIDVDSNYNVIACGGTSSWNFPVTPNAYQHTFGGGTADGFITKISYNGDQLLASTFFGSSEYDQVYFVRTSKNNSVYIYGQTKAPGSTMVHNANYNVPGAGMLLAHLSPNLNSLHWSTVFGTPLGHPNLSPTAFACDVCNRIYAAGWGRDWVHNCVQDWNMGGSTGMEVSSDAVQSTTDGEDFYIISLDQDADHIEFATFFGELHDPDISNYHGRDHVDGGTSRFDKFSTLYQSVCASCGGSNNFPTTTNAWSNTNLSSNCNNAVFRLNVHNDFPVAECLQPQVGCYPPYTIQFTNTGRGTSFHWDFGDGSTSTDTHPQHTYTESGIFRVRLIAFRTNGCQTSDTHYLNVQILSPEGHTLSSQVSCTHEPITVGTHPLPGCTYQWTTPGVSDPNIANPYVTQSGTYILVTSTPEGCTETDTFKIQYYDIIDTLILHSPTCPGGDNGYAELTLLPDAADSTIIYWDGIAGGTTSPNFAASSNTHTLYIESKGCTYSTTFRITDPPSLQYNVKSATAVCNDECDGWIKVTYGYPGQSTRDTLVEGLCDGEHTIYFTDTAGCPYSASATIIRDTALRNLKIWADDSSFFLSESVRLHVTPVEGATYSWHDPSTIDNPNSHSPLVTPVDTITVYDCQVTDEYGCSWFGSIMLHCTEVNCGRPNIFIPNAFSPNGDGQNDRLCFSGDFVLDFYLAIYSRWGEKVFETNDIHDCWDGRYNDNWCLPGVYTYYCRVKCEAGFQNLLKGDITLIR
ncbi:MAG: gliding motility-associated C-terminal domain-containing protein [Bacteroidales bacterium]|nr:gliding motility-associated C-terminal domain-containing protein [Bacteroidales bacterium]